MTKKDEFERRAKSIEALVVQLEEAADPALRVAAKDLVQAIMELHGASFERILEIVQDAGEAGSAIIERFARDEVVRGLLLLYGLHPQNLETRVSKALEAQRAYLESHGASAALKAIDETGAVTVHFEVQRSGCGSAASTVKATIEAALQEAAPDASSILVKDTGAPHPRDPAFISIAELASGGAAGRRPQVGRSGGV